VREEVDLSYLTRQLSAVIRETVQPARLSIVLFTPDADDEDSLQDLRAAPKNLLPWADLQDNRLQQVEDE
jgi:hypothetical protein